MSFSIHYRRVCSVHIEHDPSLDLGKVELAALPAALRERRLADYNVRRFLAIVPTAETENLLAQHRLRLRETPFGIEIAGSALPDDGAPGKFRLERPLEAGISLWFRIAVRSGTFHASANLPLDAPLASIYRFTNRHENLAAGELHLTAAIPAFAASASYRAGDLVVDNLVAPTVLVEARRDLPPAATATAADWLDLPFPRFTPGTAYVAGDFVLQNGKAFSARSDGKHSAPPSAPWKKIYAPAFRNGATRADLITTLPREIRLRLSPPGRFAVFRVKDETGAVIHSGTRFHDDGAPLETLEIAMPHDVPGRYLLEVESAAGAPLPGFPLNFLLLPEVATARPFGAIELHDRPGSHALFGPGGRLLGPEFHIRIRKRHTYWRYTFHGELGALPPADLGDMVQENAADPSRYVSATPLPLTDGLVPLRKFGDKTRLPNPPPGQVRREGGKLFSDTFIRL